MPDRYHPFRSAAARAEYLSYYDARAARWPIASEDRYVSTSFGQTFVRISGPEDGEPLVLLPGDTENSLAWMPQIAALSAEHRTYAIDHIYDFGRSINTRPFARPEDFVRWLDELLDALELSHINLIGFSYGGWQASLYALASPQRLSKLALIAPSATVLGPPLGPLVRAIIYYFVRVRSVVTRYLRWYNADAIRGEATRAVVDEMVDELLLSRRCFKRRKFIPPTVLTDSEWHRLSVPTLFLVGENEVTYSADRAVRRLNRVAPQVRTAVVAGAGHDLTLVRPDWVNAEVLGFLKSTSAVDR